jgi:hypothetical protein
MERIGDYLVCTSCKRKFFTEIGFQIHKNKEHCKEKSTLEAKIPTESSITSNETESFDSIRRLTWSEPEEKEALNTKGISLKSTDKTTTILTDRVLLELTDVSSRKTELLTIYNETATSEAGAKKMLDEMSNYRYHCEICQIGFKSENEWKHHLKFGHEKKRHFQCPNCDKMLTSVSNLSRHTKTVHSKIRPFQCPKCDKMFACRRNFNFHVKGVHDKIKNFHCQICKKSFVQKAHLLSHTKSVHENLKPFHCQTCDKSFALKKTLQVHTLSVHEKLRKFKCQICCNSYSTKTYLEQHTRTIHKQ